MEWEHGDLLLFSGVHCMSIGIRIGTCSKWSHVGGLAYVTAELLREAISQGSLADVPAARLAAWADSWLLFESTTLVESPCKLTGKRIKGVQAHRPIGRVMAYNGSAHLLRLQSDWKLSEEQTRKLTLGYLSDIGTEYDGRGAVTSGTRLIKRSWYFNRADMSSLFCSEMIARRMQTIHVLPLTNPARYSPRNLYRALVGSGVYLPPRQISNKRVRQHE